MASCTFCQLVVPDWEQLECGCCGMALPCITYKNEHHADQDYGGMRDLDRGEWDDEGYMCESDVHTCRICPDCAVDCRHCDLWVCKSCAEISTSCLSCIQGGLNENDSFS